MKLKKASGRGWLCDAVRDGVSEKLEAGGFTQTPDGHSGHMLIGDGGLSMLIQEHQDVWGGTSSHTSVYSYSVLGVRLMVMFSNDIESDDFFFMEGLQ